MTLADALADSLDAKHGFFYEFLTNSRHGAELVDEHNRSAGKISAASRQLVIAAMADAIALAEKRGEVQAGDDAHERADLLYLCGHGLQGIGADKPTPAHYRQRCRHLVKQLVRAWSVSEP